MTAPRLAAARAQLRHLHVPQLIADTLTASVVAMLAMLILLLVTLRAFDAVAFESHLRYTNIDTSVDAADSDDHELVVTRGSGMQVVGPDQPDLVASNGRDLSGGVEPVTWIYPDADAPTVGRVLAVSLIAGSIESHSALLDEASAALLGVTPGRELVVAGNDNQCTVVVGGIIRPFRDVDHDLAGGLLVLPSSACPSASPLPGREADPDDPANGEAPDLIGFNARTASPSAITASERLASVVREVTDIRVTGLIVPVLAVGLALWSLVISRAAQRLRHQLHAASDLLIDLGCRPRAVRATPFWLMAAITTTSAFLASWGTTRLLWHVGSVYIQTTQWVMITAVFSAIALAVLARSITRDTIKGKP